MNAPTRPAMTPPAVRASSTTTGCSSSLRPDQHGLEDVAVELLDDQDRRADDDRGEGALGDERDEHGGGADRDGADDGEERGEEGQHRQRHRQRHPDDQQRDADQDRVDQGDQRDAVDVAGQHAPHPLAELLRAGPPLRAEEADDPAPHAPPVLDEEERQHERQQDRREQVQGRERTGHGAARELLAAAALEALDAVVDRLVDLGLRHAERPQHLARLAAALLDVGAELGQLGDERRDDQRQHHGDQRDPGHDHEQRRRALVHPAVAQAVRERDEQRRQQQRDDDRHDDEQQLARDVADRDGRAREQEHAPCDRRGDRETARDAVRRPVELTGQAVPSCLRGRLRTRHSSEVARAAPRATQGRLPVQTS